MKISFIEGSISRYEITVPCCARLFIRILELMFSLGQDRGRTTCRRPLQADTHHLPGHRECQGCHEEKVADHLPYTHPIPGTEEVNG